MKTSRFEVLTSEEVKQIHSASMEVLENTGVKVDYPVARRIFQEAGAEVDEGTQVVRIPASLVEWAVAQAPGSFTLYGLDGSFSMEVGGDTTQFAALGTPTAILDLETGQRRPTSMEDVIRHIILIDGCSHIHNSQMDIWPNDIPMTTIHTESISAWAHHSRKPFGMGCYGYRPTLDMMQMMSIAVGGKEELRSRPRFFAICSTVSPLKMTQIQLEGMLICAEYGQPVAMSPEGIAGITAPATLAGLLVQENANVLAHITLAQIFRPGTPVLYGTVSTIANMRLGTVALGAVETGLITAGAAQMARYYNLPCRSVGGVTESKLEDYQAGFERTATLLPAVLAGVNLITCAGTLDSTMLESDALLVLDDEICAAVLRMARGIEVSSNSLAAEVIHKVGYSGSFLAEKHTLQTFKSEHFMPTLLPREGYEAWVKGGSKTAIDLARQKARRILADHRPQELPSSLSHELDGFRQQVAQRPIEEFYEYEAVEFQELFAHLQP